MNQFTKVNKGIVELSNIETANRIHWFQYWSKYEPDECKPDNNHAHRFLVRVLPALYEYSNRTTTWRSITTENEVLRQWDFILMTIIHHCCDRGVLLQISKSSQYGYSVDIRDTDNSCLTNSYYARHAGYAALGAYVGYLEGLAIGLFVVNKERTFLDA